MCFDCLALREGFAGPLPLVARRPARERAHRLRKPTNKFTNAIKQAIAPFRKVLLTAAPLQNSPPELYGLGSSVDDFSFGDLRTYHSRFTRLGNDDDFHELKERLKPVCKRTLRKQVLE